MAVPQDQKKKRALWQWLVPLIVGALFAALIAALTDPAGAEDTVSFYRMMSDMFSVPGLILLAVFVMAWISTTGLFDIFTYAFKNLIYLFTPLKYRTSNYYEYREEQAAKRKPVPYGILWVALGFLAVGLLFLALFYSVYRG